MARLIEKVYGVPGFSDKLKIKSVSHEVVFWAK